MISLTLEKAIVGKDYLVDHLSSGFIQSKLIEMGLFKGQSVTLVFKAPFGGPIAVNVGGYLLSLRLDEACMVVIHPKHSNH